MSDLVPGYRLGDRPGYFGKRRDQRIEELNQQHGEGNWILRWVVASDRDAVAMEYKTACKLVYEASYVSYLKAKPELHEWLESYGECYDNAPSNVLSGLDYRKQENDSTHIQDIAVRNAMRTLGLSFKGPPEKLLEIRSRGEGLILSPGVVPCYDPLMICGPSLCPRWANEGSVEDFWQSNKFVFVRHLSTP